MGLYGCGDGHLEDIGEQLIRFAKENLGAERLWTLEKNHRAIKFYECNGFRATGNRVAEDGTPEFLLEMRVMDSRRS